MKFSLVLATVGRTTELSRFLVSLNEQKYRDFELIIVDQNEDDRLISLLEPFQGVFPILYLHSDVGLSKARNVGLKHISGDIAAFPDDDCWYSESLLQYVASLFDENPHIDGFTGQISDGVNTANVRQCSHFKKVTLQNVWKLAFSISIFLRRQAIDAVGNFDESLGVGANTEWGSGEETDCLIRVIKNGYGLNYCSNLVVYHPKFVHTYNEKSYLRALNYGGGMGRVLRKHRYPYWFTGYSFLRPLGGTLISLMIGNIAKARYHLAVFRGRLLGWLA